MIAMGFIPLRHSRPGLGVNIRMPDAPVITMVTVAGWNGVLGNGDYTDPATISSNGIGNGETITLKGTAEASATVRVFQDGDQKGDTTADGVGAWEIELTSIMTFVNNQVNSLTAMAIVAGNNSVLSAIFHLTLMATP